VKKAGITLFVLALAACGKSEGTIDLVKTVASEARTKPRVEMDVKTSGEVATPTDLALQKTIEDRIEQAHIGRIVSTGTEAGYLKIVVEVENTADAITELRRISQTAGVLNRSSFKVSSGS
jgi:hypothetical protein